jgi:methyl-accepting chemotaxis protein
VDLSMAKGQSQVILGAINRLLDSATNPARALSTSIQTMSSEHERGDIDVIIPVDKFRGEYAVMAKDINELVGAHIAVKKMAMAYQGIQRRQFRRADATIAGQEGLYQRYD